MTDIGALKHTVDQSAHRHDRATRVMTGCSVSCAREAPHARVGDELGSLLGGRPCAEWAVVSSFGSSWPTSVTFSFRPDRTGSVKPPVVSSSLRLRDCRVGADVDVAKPA
jgi:hypothetical protein